jgi:hypothetical protein
MREHRVRALLMGGQACVFYGAAEFSRDTDFAILADAANFARLRDALDELQAGPIAVPPSELDYLRRGHAIHFRCQHPDALRMRVDVMSRMRGVDSFDSQSERGYPCQFSTFNPATRPNSLTLRVTTVAPSRRAWAAISVSIGPIPCPRDSRSCRIAA